MVRAPKRDSNVYMAGRLARNICSLHACTLPFLKDKSFPVRILL